MITVSHLTKRYGEHTAVDDVSFSVGPGTVAGFLGPNGAGKSTTMRMIVGLTVPSAGTAAVLDTAYRDIPNPGTRVGVLLDASAQHAGRTGREVLHLGAMTMGLPDSRVDEMLAVVGLSASEAKRRVGNYSLGMRQRLGIAHALLGAPEVLILDEPANGLDPAGIRWMRDLLRSFAAGGGTVLLSSHLLTEVEQVADMLIVIGSGRIVAQGAKDDMLASGGVFVRTVDDARIAALAQAAGIEALAQPAGGLMLRADIETVSQLTFDNGVRVTELRGADHAGLEDLFLELTGDTQRTETPLAATTLDQP